MAESGLFEIVFALARMLAIGAGILSFIVFVSVAWLYLSELRQKET
jgi:hypothetical protein